MIAVAAVVIAAVAPAASSDPGRAGCLGRFAIVAGRATVVVASPKPFDPQRPFDLRACACDGPGNVTVAQVDIAAPWERMTLRFPAYVRPNGLGGPAQAHLRHSHSRYGLYVGGEEFDEGVIGDADPSSMLSGSTIPGLETINRRLEHFGPNVPNTPDPWPAFRDNSVPRLDMSPLRFARERNIPINKAECLLHHDFLITESAECELYLLEPGGRIERLVKSILPSRELVRPGIQVSKRWKKTASVPNDHLEGAFAIVPHRNSRYLVSRAGVLVKIVDRGKPLAKGEVVAGGESIRVVLHDTDRDKRYVVTATHYYEVTEPVRPKGHEIKRLDFSNGAAALETAFHCARAVRGLPPVPFPADPAKK